MKPNEPQTSVENEVPAAAVTAAAGEKEAVPVARPSVTRSAGIVSIAVMFSRLLGLVRETMFAHFFGAGMLYDAFQVAFRIPNVLRDLFAEGALSAAFVKVFTDYQVTKSEEETWRLANLVLNALAVVLSIVTIIGIIFSRQFVMLIAPEFSPEAIELTTTLTQIMFPFILLVAMAALAMGILNTKGIFGIPASASTVFNVISIVFGLGLAFWLSGGSWETDVNKSIVPSGAAQWAIIGMAIGTLLGGAAQFLIQVPSLLKLGFRFQPVFDLADAGVRRVMSLMTPAILGTSAVQVNVLVNTFFVTGIVGGVSWLSYSFRLMQFPIGLFGVAVGTASVPVLSRMASEGRTGDFRETLSSSINLVFLMTLPAACGLVVLGEPIIRLIYLNGGRFTETDVQMTAAALAGYSIGLTGYAAIKVLSPAFYALDDAKTPMIIGIASIAVNAVSCYFLMQMLSTVGVSAANPSGFGHVGVALATSVVALVNFFALAYFMRRKIGRLNGREIARSFAKIALASAVMTAACWVSYHFIGSQFAVKTFAARLAEAFVPIFIGGAVFIAAAKVLKIGELEKFFKMLSRRLGRS